MAQKLFKRKQENAGKNKNVSIKRIVILAVYKRQGINSYRWIGIIPLFHFFPYVYSMIQIVRTWGATVA